MPYRTDRRPSAVNVHLHSEPRKERHRLQLRHHSESHGGRPRTFRCARNCFHGEPASYFVDHLRARQARRRRPSSYPVGKSALPEATENGRHAVLAEAGLREADPRTTRTELLADGRPRANRVRDKRSSALQIGDARRLSMSKHGVQSHVEVAINAPSGFDLSGQHVANATPNWTAVAQ